MISLKNKILYQLALFTRYRNGIAHFTKPENPFYWFYSQSYAKIVNTIKPLMEQENWLPELKTALVKLQANPIWDDNYNEPFCHYDDLCIAFWEILQDECIHELEKFHEGAICKKCEQYFGWYCPKSPDNQCHYFVFEYENKTGLLLANGETMELNKPDYETFDSCIFCGQPKERK